MFVCLHIALTSDLLKFVHSPIYVLFVVVRIDYLSLWSTSLLFIDNHLNHRHASDPKLENVSVTASEAFARNTGVFHQIQYACTL